MHALAPLLALLLGAAAPAAEAPAASHAVVLVDGTRLAAVERPRWAFGRASVVLVDGRRLNLEWKQVDHEATRAADPLAAGRGAAPRVFTQEDLERLRRGRLNVVDNGGPAPALEAKAAEPGDADPRAEQRWRSQALALRQDIQRQEAMLEHLERARESWEAFALAGGGDYDAAAASKLAEIRRARRESQARLERSRGDWARLQEDARTSGILPGWLR